MSKALSVDEIRNRIIEVRKVRFGDIADDPRNPKNHPPAQREALRGAIREIGFASVPLARHSELTGKLTWADGHMRGSELADYVGDVAILDINDAEAALMLATFDPLAAMAETNAERLRDVLAEVRTGEAALQAMLAEMAERAGIVPKGATTGDTPPQIDKAEELRKKWQVEPGQLWALGEHRLICGDCTDKATVERVMGGESYVLITDPPYGIAASGMTMGIKQSSLPKEQRLSNVPAWDDQRPDISALRSGAMRSCIWGAQYFAHDLPISGDWLCWDKKNYMRSFSECEFAWTDYGSNVRILQHHWSGEEKIHITQKPLLVVEWTIKQCPELQAIVFDPFLGSGTTIIACENLSRRCRAIEISPAYTAVCLQRFLDHTGIQPFLLEAS